MLLAGSVYGYMIGAICTAISAMDPASTAFKQMMDLLSLHMHEEQCPPEMRMRFRQYFIRSRDMLRDEYYKDVIEKLSPALQSELAIHCHKKVFASIPFFNCDDKIERRALVVNMRRCCNEKRS